jgi:starvation-inducible DNA-binding protein
MATQALLFPDTEPEALQRPGWTQDRAQLAVCLSEVLADTCILSIKTQSFHWNIVGPLFHDAHKLTEVQYQDMAESIEEIAERIRAIGHIAPGSFEQFKKLSEITEAVELPSAEEMIRQLHADNQTCCQRLRKAAAEAQRVKDVKTLDLLTDRIGQHEQNVRLLRFLLVG